MLPQAVSQLVWHVFLFTVIISRDAIWTRNDTASTELAAYEKIMYDNLRYLVGNRIANKMSSGGKREEDLCCCRCR